MEHTYRTPPSDPCTAQGTFTCASKLARQYVTAHSESRGCCLSEGHRRVPHSIVFLIANFHGFRSLFVLVSECKTRRFRYQAYKSQVPVFLEEKTAETAPRENKVVVEPAKATTEDGKAACSPSFSFPPQDTPTELHPGLRQLASNAGGFSVNPGGFRAVKRTRVKFDQEQFLASRPQSIWW
jgi:hypothetical protein